jgi:hypothetical protein
LAISNWPKPFFLKSRAQRGNPMATRVPRQSRHVYALQLFMRFILIAAISIKVWLQ